MGTEVGKGLERSVEFDPRALLIVVFLLRVLCALAFPGTGVTLLLKLEDMLTFPSLSASRGFTGLNVVP